MGVEYNKDFKVLLFLLFMTFTLNLLSDFYRNVYISPQDYFVVFFSILGIIATILAIAVSLTKEQRQDITIDYLLKDNFTKLYLGLIFFSFVIPFCFYLIFPSSIILQIIITLFLMINFISTFFFIFYFLLNINRKSIYNKLFNEFKGEIK